MKKLLLVLAIALSFTINAQIPTATVLTYNAVNRLHPDTGEIQKINEFVSVTLTENNLVIYMNEQFITYTIVHDSFKRIENEEGTYHMYIKIIEEIERKISEVIFLEGGDMILFENNYVFRLYNNSFKTKYE